MSNTMILACDIWSKLDETDRHQLWHDDDKKIFVYRHEWEGETTLILLSRKEVMETHKGDALNVIRAMIDLDLNDYPEENLIYHFDYGLEEISDWAVPDVTSTKPRSCVVLVCNETEYMAFGYLPSDGSEPSSDPARFDTPFEAYSTLKAKKLKCSQGPDDDDYPYRAGNAYIIIDDPACWIYE